VWTTSVEVLAGEIMAWKQWEAPATVEAIFKQCLKHLFLGKQLMTQPLTCDVYCFFSGLSPMAGLPKLIGKHSVFKRPPPPPPYFHGAVCYVCLSKWEVRCISGNTRKVIYWHCLFLEYATISCCVSLSLWFWMAASLLHLVDGVSECSGVGRYILLIYLLHGAESFFRG